MLKRIILGFRGKANSSAVLAVVFRVTLDILHAEHGVVPHTGVNQRLLALGADVDLFASGGGGVLAARTQGGTTARRALGAGLGVTLRGLALLLCGKALGQAARGAGAQLVPVLGRVGQVAI